MITITHEGHGPYIERTVIDYHGIRSHADVPCDASFESIINNQDDTPENLRARIQELEGQIKEDERDHEDHVQGLEDEIGTLTKERDDRDALLDESDPGAAMRDEIAALKRQIESLESRYEGMRQRHVRACDELNQARAVNRSLKAGIIPPVKRKVAKCACGGTFSRRSRHNRESKCHTCGTPKGSEPSAELLARVKEMHAA